MGLRSVWSWGWAAWSTGERDPDKPTAACVYLWARDPSLCNGPSAAGKGFNTSLTEGQLVLPAGTRCTLYGRPVTESTISSLTPVTGDPDVAFTAAFARAVTSLAGRAQGQAARRRRACGRGGPLRRQLRALPRRARQGAREPRLGARR